MFVALIDQWRHPGRVTNGKDTLVMGSTGATKSALRKTIDNLKA